MLSDLFDKTVTVINAIPKTEETPAAWTKTVLSDCAVSGGIFDRSSGTMVYAANTFTVYARAWRKYRVPSFSDGGYYSVYPTEKDAFTANAGDLVILCAIDEDAPQTAKEFNDLRTKYAREGGILSSAEAFIRFKPDGTPWETNHIEMIRG